MRTTPQTYPQEVTAQVSTRSTDPAPPTGSEELFAPVGAGIELCYQTFGTPPHEERGGEPLLLIMGLGGPMTWWDERLCHLLVDRGFYVIRYDNRDSGRSTRASGRVTRSTLVRAFAGRAVRPPYTLG